MSDKRKYFNEQKILVYIVFIMLKVYENQT